MHPSDHLWKLSFEELAQKCQELGHGDVKGGEAGLQEEARRLYSGWKDAFSIGKHDNDAAERIAAATSSLRKRTIELLVRAEQHAQG